LLININNAIKFTDYVQPQSLSLAKEQLGINKKNCMVIGAIGRLTEQKDWITYIKAADEVLKIFPDTVFLIVGDGELRQFLCGLIQDLGLSRNILIVGHRPNVAEIYAAIDIFITTSVWEGLPYVILEAMWYRKPIVATNVGYDDVITDKENGFLVKVKDYKLLAQRINELICNKVLRSVMGQKGRDQVTSNFSFHSFIKSHEELYKGTFNNSQK
jgi:glycosyltransferase involved in cell wall biosynthesis